MWSIYGLIETNDRRYWLEPVIYYENELLARVTADYLNKMMTHFNNDDVCISFFIHKD